MLTIDPGAILSAITPGIRAVVEDAVSAAVDQIVGDRLLDTREAALLLGISESSLRKRAQRGTVSCVRTGRTLRFRRSVLLTSDSSKGSI